MRFYVNEIDLSLYGLLCNPPDGWLDAPAVSYAGAPIPGLAGTLIAGDEGAIAPRSVSVSGTLIGGGTPESTQTRWDAVKRLLAGHDLELRFDGWPELIGRGVYLGAQWQRVRTLRTGGRFLLSFLLPDPFLYARQVDVYTIAAHDGTVALDLGTAPAPVDLYLLSTGAGEPAVEYRDAQGRTVGKVGFTIAAAAFPQYDWIFVDGRSGLATLHSTPVATTTASDANQYLMPDAVPFVADPQDADGTQGPSLRAVNCAVVAHVRKAYR